MGFAAASFRNPHPPHWLWSIRFRAERIAPSMSHTLRLLPTYTFTYTYS